MAAGLLALSLAGCGASQRGIDPVAWWHGLEGGPIAAQRPPPPDANAPYPNLATVPPRPPPIDPAMRARVSAALAADRADASYEARQEPLGPAPPKAASGLFAGATPLPPPSADTAGAALEAAAPSPAVAPPPHAAPTPKPVAAAAPAAAALPPDTPPPAIADVPPPPPRLAGVVIPVTIAHLPPAAPPRPPAIEAALTASGRAALSLGFPSGSALLPPAMLPSLRSLAGRRGSHAIAIAGFGEAAAPDPFTQSNALRLGVARARAVAVALLQDGVPMAALHLQADAAGTGAAARIVE